MATNQRVDNWNAFHPIVACTVAFYLTEQQQGILSNRYLPSLQMNRQLKLRDGQRLADEDYDTLVHCLFTAIHCGYSHHVSTILDMAQDSSAVASAEHTVNVRMYVS